MPMTTPRPRSRQPKQLDAGIFQAEISSFALRLAAEGKAAKTIRTYTEAVQWFAAAGLPSRASWEQVGSQDIQRWMAWLLDRYSARLRQQPVPCLAAVLQMAGRRRRAARPDGRAAAAARPRSKLVPVFTSEELRRLDQACAGRSFAQRRDTAIIAVFTATGIRLSELACPLRPVTCGAATSTCGSGRSPSAARAARTGSSRSATRPPGAWTGTPAPAPGTPRPGGRSCGSEPATGSR